jgi:iduronate 2-sulfatase
MEVFMKTVNRRQFLSLIGGCAAVSAVDSLVQPLASNVLAQSAKPVAAKRNVLFIAVDDLRPELGCYGKDYIQSPNIDRIAKSGMVFNHAYCQQAVCSPSRSSVMTGARPDTTKVWDLVTHFRTALPDVVTLGQFFKQNGYFVQGMGKIYHGGFNDTPTWSVPWQTPKAAPYALPENLTLNQRQYEGEPDDALSPKPRKKAAQAPKTADNTSTSKRNSRGPAFEGANVPDNTFQDGKVAELAVSTLRDLSIKQEPFFLAVGFIKPHLPFVSPKKYWDIYDPAKIKLAPNKFRPKDAPDYAILPGSELRAYNAIPEGSIPDDLARQLKHGYYAAVSYMDTQVGKVLDELDRLGLRDNTIIVLWGDHGWKLGEHDAWCKHSNCENDTNAPLLISVPGMKNAGVHTDALVEFVDIYPTLSDLAGLSLPSHLEGTSLKPLLDDPKRAWKSAAFSQYPRPAGKTGGSALMGYSMRTDRYRFTVWVDRKDHTLVNVMELYDHQTDPQENTNIAKDPANADLVKRLLDQWKKGWQGAKPPIA